MIKMLLKKVRGKPSSESPTPETAIRFVADQAGSASYLKAIRSSRTGLPAQFTGIV